MSWLLLIALAFDLGAAKSEPNPERRSDRALENAGLALTSAVTAYDRGDFEHVETALDEVKDSVDLSYQSLEESGKKIRDSSHAKNAEKTTRQLLRRLESFRSAVSFADRDLIESIVQHVSEIHDNLLNDIMGTRKK